MQTLDYESNTSDSPVILRLRPQAVNQQDNEEQLESPLLGDPKLRVNIIKDQPSSNDVLTDNFST